eukprot:3132197-Amphidinium_carterae.1
MCLCVTAPESGGSVNLRPENLEPVHRANRLATGQPQQRFAWSADCYFPLAMRCQGSSGQVRTSSPSSLNGLHFMVQLMLTSCHNRGRVAVPGSFTCLHRVLRVSSREARVIAQLVFGPEPSLYICLLPCSNLLRLITRLSETALPMQYSIQGGFSHIHSWEVQTRD